MTAARILVVDDEPNIRDLLVTSLRFAGYQVRAVANGAQTISAVLEEEPDLIILDVMLPDMNGFSVTKRLRGAGYTAPILFLTAKDATEDKIEGLNSGGDDYVTKPFSLEELLARVRNVLRRTGAAEPDSSRLSFEDLELDEDTREVTRGGAPIELTNKEFGVLEELLKAKGGVVSSEELLERVWDANTDPFTTTVRVTINTLRKKIGDPPLIETVVGAGYRVPEPVVAS